jgi:hypothetical protein
MYAVGVPGTATAGSTEGDGGAAAEGVALATEAVVAVALPAVLAVPESALFEQPTARSAARRPVTMPIMRLGKVFTDDALISPFPPFALRWLGSIAAPSNQGFEGLCRKRARPGDPLAGVARRAELAAVFEGAGGPFLALRGALGGACNG